MDKENDNYQFDDVDDWASVEDEGGLKALTHGTMLKVARNRLALSQQAMANLLGVSAASYRNWEQHRTAPDNAAKTLIELVYGHTSEVAIFLRDRVA